MIGYETGEGLLIDMNEMKTLWKDANRKAGKPSTTFNYSGAMVKADAIENVSDIENKSRGWAFKPTRWKACASRWRSRPG